jgi:uncharacterized protein (TIGR03437 family)
LFFFLLIARAAEATVTVSAVTDAAGYGPRVAPGSLATIFGAGLAASTEQASATPLLTSLGGTTVTIGGTAVPLIYVSPAQIDFQVPYATTAGTQTLVVTSGGSASSAFSFLVVSQAPAIFQYGTNHAVAQDGNAAATVNASTAPAASGSVITVYLTGQGAVNHPVADGTETPSSPLATATATATATIGVQSATVEFLGLSPGFVGLAQANIKVPDLPTGDYPLVINVGGIVSASAVISVSGSGTYTSPLTFVGSVNFSNSSVSSVALLDNVLYVCGTDRIVMVDVTTPASPTYLGEFGDGALDGYGSVCAVNNVLSSPFLVDIIGPPLMTDVSFAVYDLTTPTAPNLLSVTATNYANVVDLSFNTSGYGYFTTNYITYNTSNEEVEAQNGDFLAYSFLTPSEPTLVGELQPNTGAVGSSDVNLKPFTELVGPVTAYIATSTATGTDTTGTGALTVVDLSNPYSPIPVNEISAAPANLLESFDVSGTTLLAAGNTAGQRNPGKPDFDFLGNLSLMTMDVASIEAPVVQASFDTGMQVNGTMHTAAFSNGVFAIVSNAPATDDTGPASLMIVDARTPTNPVLYTFQSQFGFSGILPTTTGYLFAPTVNGLNVYYLQLQ